jgi:hypothetical protein
MYIQTCLKVYLILYSLGKHTVPFRIFGESTQFLTAFSGKVHIFIPGSVKAQNLILHIRRRCQKNPRQFFLKLAFRTTQGLQYRGAVLWGPQLLKWEERKHPEKKTFVRAVYPNNSATQTCRSKTSGPLQRRRDDQATRQRHYHLKEIPHNKDDCTVHLVCRGAIQRRHCSKV